MKHATSHKGGFENVAVRSCTRACVREVNVNGLPLLTPHPCPSAIISVVEGSEGMVFSNAAMVSSLAKGST